MRKPVVVPLSVLLLLAAVLLLAGTAELWTRPAVAVESQAVLSTVRSYYAAVDLFLETGDMSGVREVVAPSLLDLPQTDEQTDNFMLFLRALRETYPRVSIDVVDISISSTVAVVQVRVDAGPAAKVAGIQMVDRLTRWQMTETFEVVANQIAGYRSTGPSLGMVASTPEMPMEAMLFRPGKLVVGRLTFDASSSGYVSIPAPAMLIVEQGEVLMEGNGVAEIVRSGEPNGTVTEPGVDVLARAGDAIVVDAARAVLSNVSGAPASLLAVVIDSNEAGKHPWEQHVSAPPLTKVFESPDSASIGDGIVARALDVSAAPLTEGPASITSKLTVLTAGGSVVLTGDASVVAIPLASGVSIDHDELTGQRVVHNAGDSLATFWAVVIE